MSEQNQSAQPNQPLKVVPSETGTESKRNPPNKPLPTDRLAFTKQMDLLRAWVAASGANAKAVTNKDVAPIIKLSDNTTSLANAFFIASGFLMRGDGGYTPS